MKTRLFFLMIAVSVWVSPGYSQCTTYINSFPYLEGFETSNGNWVSGGSGDDWAWGTPAKPVINTAGAGTKCWMIGGLTGGSYTNSEASYLQSPCFDFTLLVHPYISFKVFWEMEYQFDGASLQYSTDDGATWTTVGSSADPKNCLNDNWYNNASINYLSPLTANKTGWTGNIQPNTGSCRGGNGSNGWVFARRTMPYLAGKGSVIFRFIFGAGSICNNYDGFAIDDIYIREAPANTADFTYTCSGNGNVTFVDRSSPCPQQYNWNFGDPASGTANTSTLPGPVHQYTAAGNYTVTLTVGGPDNNPATITKNVSVLGVTTSVVTPADCNTGLGGEAMATVSGGVGPYTYSWNSVPVQTTMNLQNVQAGTYMVTVSGTGACPNSATVDIPLSTGCGGPTGGIYFPTAFTPNNDGKNDGFGVIGGIGLLTSYRLSVYNRWGQLVFRTTNPFEKWDGKTGGAENTTGIFVWKAEYKVLGGKEERQRGTVVIIH